MRRMRNLVVLTLTLVLAAACASGGRRSEGPREEVVFVIDNNLPIPVPITVYILSNVGERALLGSINPGSTRELVFRRANISGSYRLVARIRRGSDITSQLVALNGGETVDWELRNNTALVRR